MTVCGQSDRQRVIGILARMRVIFADVMQNCPDNPLGRSRDRFLKQRINSLVVTRGNQRQLKFIRRLCSKLHYDDHLVAPVQRALPQPHIQPEPAWLARNSNFGLKQATLAGRKIHRHVRLRGVPAEIDLRHEMRVILDLFDMRQIAQGREGAVGEAVDHEEVPVGAFTLHAPSLGPLSSGSRLHRLELRDNSGVMSLSPAPLSGQPYLFIDAQHGLCNRLRAIASAAAIAEMTGRELVVVWVPDHHCEGHLADIIDYPGLVIRDADHARDLRAGAALDYNYMEIEDGAVFNAPILEQDDTGGDVYVRAAYTLNSVHRDYRIEQAFLRGLVPTASVVDLIAGVRRPNDVAAHVRMGTGPEHDHLSYESPENWPAERHAELIRWRQASHADRFIARIEALGDAAETIFLAADLPETYNRFADRFGDRLAFLPREDFDRSARQLHYALADLILLSSASHFLASNWSSFSDVAQRLAREDRVMEQSGVDF